MAEIEKSILDKFKEISKKSGIDIKGAKVRRTSSRFCLGVEHGDYNGTELFGVGTDRFIWFAYKPNESDRVRLYSANFPQEGIVEYQPGRVPSPRSPEIFDKWSRFPYGIDYILHKRGFKLQTGIDGIIYGNIPGGGMSRSASLTLNLLLSILDANGIKADNPFDIVDMAQAVENEYIGSPCGQMDQIMILFAREGMGTHYNPRRQRIDYIPLGKGGDDMRLVVLDTGTDRPGLDKSTYKIRCDECRQFVELIIRAGFKITCLADVNDESLYRQILEKFAHWHPDYCDRLKYIYKAQKRFYEMLKAWREGDIKTAGAVFRDDGIGLRDEYKISGPQLETMCDIARTVDGVLGERMLGGGDKGAAGAIVRAGSVEKLRCAVASGYPKIHPGFADKFAVHVCKMVSGVEVYEEVI
jgi:galactokinase